MPGLDGVDLVRRIRHHSQNGYVYTILLTARSQKEDVVEGMEAGADDFVTKPFDAGELHARLRAGERILSLEHSLASRNRQLDTANDRMQRDLEAAAQPNRHFTLALRDIDPSPPPLLNRRVSWYPRLRNSEGGVRDAVLLDGSHRLHWR